ncbi:3-ketoacyl-ACP reductase [Sediminibacillus dalangtanensis]|uniref:3-ketoacyl-ACP reductase n=1 Tax=Sediminibacillus dalangtanensis TaxID=2729421 RepID=A0ABX7VVA4_9BACI|nr:3-ketoacyl-ACP reductase [Sediminibacillus dalangtanensis]QTN00622.1 3-ketoacyl-ACP reductase [Sediminibacillus dalangtanensis]
MAQSLQGKVAYITGGGKGIGRATALALAKEGVKIGLIARTLSDLQAVAEEITAHGGEAAYATADVSDLSQVEAAVKAIEQKIGSADILINNAGIGKYDTFLDFDPEDWKRVIEVNLMGVYYVTRTVLPQLIKKNRGDIINISSTSGLRGTPGSSAYSASKFGLLGMTESLAQEVRKHNIRVAALTPSTVATELVFKDKLDEVDQEKYMQPEDLAEYMVAQLKLHPRIFIKSASLWATNPF